MAEIEPEPLHPQRLTWAALLGRWVEFARTAVALPEAGAEGHLRESVADIIALQAVCFALEQIEDLARAERPLAVDRARVLVARHTAMLRRRWGDDPMPDALEGADRRRRRRDRRGPGCLAGGVHVTLPP